MRVALLDLETNGLNPGDHQITEIGVIIVEQTPEHFGLKVLETFNFLVWEPYYPPQSEIILKLTGITDEDLKSEGIAIRTACSHIGLHMDQLKVDAIMAHNKQFDERFLKHHVKSAKEKGISEDDNWLNVFLELPWLCSMNDIAHPREFKCKKLSHLALDYGVAVDPKTLHRAIGDLTIMKEMLECANVNFEKMLGRSRIPDVIVKACVPNPFGANSDGGVGKDKAKSLGFSWEKIGEKTFPKTWVKSIKENEIEQLKKELGYEVRILA